MQGRLFQSCENSAAVRGDLTPGERVHAVAISIASSPATHRVWSMMATMGPSEMYTAMASGKAPALQNYLAGRHPVGIIEAARRIIEESDGKSIRIITYWDAEYPYLLREIPAPPVVLYLRGRFPRGPAVAVVGARKSDQRSSSHARRIARDLAIRGYAVVSGMAVGVDREAHLGALEGGGATVGVLANGIDIAYPWQNRDIYRRIRESEASALVSEYPPGTIAGRWTFVRRNRIISGLCAGTVVVKAGERSGALITARHAIDQNREVFACAGYAFDGDYAGCHRLIRNGAVLVSSTDDIIDELWYSCGILPPAPAPGGQGEGEGHIPGGEPPDALEVLILDLLGEGDRDIDSLVRATAVAPGAIHRAIMNLELRERVTRSGNTLSRK
ncbi:MAG: DNA-processing protein DprA [Spirochaetes bacterium]|nr:DNA-processing protein DprA [Spirochaetota bacterium]